MTETWTFQAILQAMPTGEVAGEPSLEWVLAFLKNLHRAKKEAAP